MWVSLECKPSPNGKPLIKASQKNVGAFLAGIRRTIKAAHGVFAAELIDQLNPKIRGNLRGYAAIRINSILKRRTSKFGWCMPSQREILGLRVNLKRRILLFKDTNTRRSLIEGSRQL